MHVTAAEERQLIVEVLGRFGTDPTEAVQVTDVYVEADLRGYASHGLLRLPKLLERLAAGTCLPGREAVILRERPAALLLDGQRGYGQSVGTRAIALAMERARSTGMAGVGVLRANHIGLAGYYAEQAARRGMVGLVLTITEPTVHPFGGAEKMIGTNPLAIGIPVEAGAPFVLDMATSATALGKVLAARDIGRPIPAGWAVDAEGNPTTDPEAVLSGALSPFGGAKGYGLGLAIELLAGALLGGETGERVTGTLEADAPVTKGDLYVAFDPGAFGEPAAFQAKVRRYLDEIKNSRKAPGHDEILYPGERAWRERERRLAEGYEVSDGVWEEVAATNPPRK